MHMNMRAFIGVATPAPLADRIAGPVHQTRARALKDRPFKAEKDSLVPGDLMIVCLWSTAGLVLTGLLASLGFGDQIAQFLAAVC
jgi:hypothetical protein